MTDSEKNTGDFDRLLLDIDGYEGPIDVLLELSRNQKVDIAKISILQLVRQYLDFIEHAKLINLDLAAEYLVMASWMVYLKSRLLLPKEENSDEPSAEDIAQALQFQLIRLEAMQGGSEKLLELPILGQDVFARGQVEDLGMKTQVKWNVSLYDMLKAYGDIENRKEGNNYKFPEFNLMSTEDAMARLVQMLGGLPKKGMSSVWTTLRSFISDDDGEEDELYSRSALSSTFTASLELAKQGRVEFRQDGLFRPVYMRSISSVEDC